MPLQSPPRPVRRLAPLLAIPTVAAIVLAGVWIAGGIISNDFHTSMALTAGWFAVSGGACLLIARRVRPLRTAVIGAYLTTALLAGAYLGQSTLRDRVVDESVITAAMVAPAPTGAATMAATRRSAPVEVARGRLRSHEHETTGAATVVRLPDGRRFLTLTRFNTSSGPDLRVRVAPGGSHEAGADGAVDLGALKGNRGDQQYAIPRGMTVKDKTVVIWCRAFSVAFGSARL